MTDNGNTDPDLGPAGRRLSDLLPLLVDDPNAPAAPKTQRVMQSVRWERALRLAAAAIGNIALVVADGVTAALRPPGSRKRNDR